MTVELGHGIDEFRATMARFASGVVVATTRDADGNPHGFTASSFCSVSLDPPLVLVCLAETANSYEAFRSSSACAISILAEDQVGVARRFATKGGDKFAGAPFTSLPEGGLGVPGALGVMECEVRDRHAAGDHVILVAEVQNVRVGPGRPMVYFGSEFHRLGG
ncbi:flavin reductase family protein [Streptomyces olivoreticuli]|uniref:flavin reductase family protein n=1 Tax=Streptomyces olivoreticuli TaxID=68246 RepID=UPI000E232292|nr:flavin reductase family protein [Streptomyces olivoreticuli]